MGGAAGSVLIAIETLVSNNVIEINFAVNINVILWVNICNLAQ
jgi:hypothetical protein